jgi:hypothetical protein
VYSNYPDTKTFCFDNQYGCRLSPHPAPGGGGGGGEEGSQTLPWGMHCVLWALLLVCFAFPTPPHRMLCGPIPLSLTRHWTQSKRKFIGGVDGQRDGRTDQTHQRNDRDHHAFCTIRSLPIHGPPVPVFTCAKILKGKLYKFPDSLPQMLFFLGVRS